MDTIIHYTKIYKRPSPGTVPHPPPACDAGMPPNLSGPWRHSTGGRRRGRTPARPEQGGPQPLAIKRARRGLSTIKASATTTKFVIAVTTNTMCQPPVAVLTTLASGTRNADAPLAV